MIMSAATSPGPQLHTEAIHPHSSLVLARSFTLQTHQCVSKHISVCKPYVFPLSVKVWIHSELAWKCKEAYYVFFLPLCFQHFLNFMCGGSLYSLQIWNIVILNTNVLQKVSLSSMHALSTTQHLTSCAISQPLVTHSNQIYILHSAFLSLLTGP